MSRESSPVIVAVCAMLGCFPRLAEADPIPYFSEVSKYLVVATGEGTQSSQFASFRMSSVEIGADQELVSSSGNGSPSQSTGSLQNGSTPNLFGVFLGTLGANAAVGGNRWNDTDPRNHPGDTVGIPDRLPSARPLFEGIDYSGNVALTGRWAKLESSNSDVYANLGIQCNRAAGCFPNPSSDNSYFSGPGNPEQNLNAGAGISQFNPTALIGELGALRDAIVALTPELTLTSGFVNKNIKDSGSPQTTDLDAIDINGDGIAVIDLDLNNSKFELNNTDWILKSTKGTKAIFRMADGTYFDFANSSIMLGDGNPNSQDVIDELGAIFFQDAYKGTNELFKLNNVILGGIGLYDLADFNPNRELLLNPADSQFSQLIGDGTLIDSGTRIYFGDQTEANAGQNAQGCAQFISHEVVMSNNRWNRCSISTTTVPEPASLWLIAFALAGLGFARWRAKR